MSYSLTFQKKYIYSNPGHCHQSKIPEKNPFPDAMPLDSHGPIFSIGPNIFSSITSFSDMSLDIQVCIKIILLPFIPSLAEGMSTKKYLSHPTYNSMK